MKLKTDPLPVGRELITEISLAIRGKIFYTELVFFIWLLIAELFGLFLLSRQLTQSLSYLLHALTKSKTITIYMLALLFLPGTFIHEVAHYLMAHLLFVHAEGLELMPKLQGEGVKLGSVQIVKTDPFRRAIIGVAPFLFGTALILLTLVYMFRVDFYDNIYVKVFVGYIVFEIGNTMFSSKKDLEGTLELVAALTIVYIVLYLLGLRLPHLDPAAVLPPTAFQFVQLACWFVGVPIAIDIIAVVCLKILHAVLYR